MENPKSSLALTIGLTLAVGVSCVPAHLAKYQSTESAQEPVQDDALRDPAAQAAPTKPSSVNANGKPSIYAVDDSTFRFEVKADKVLDAVIDTLLHNYNLTIVDKNTGVVSTDWDSFFLDGKVYRNRVTLRVRRLGGDRANLTIHNNVESLSDSQSTGSGAWIPAEDNQGEAARIVQNLATVLQEPPPRLLPGIPAPRNPGEPQSDRK